VKHEQGDYKWTKKEPVKIDVLTEPGKTISIDGKVKIAEVLMTTYYLMSEIVWKDERTISKGFWHT
jgi:hypothetical protein